MTKLESLLKKISENERVADLNETFEEIAIELIQNSVLIAGELRRRIREIEFYLSNRYHLDHYVHGYKSSTNKRQLQFGEWYFHKSGRKGLDLTFGNERNNIFGGILIRGIEGTNQNGKAINGPSKLVNSIIENIGTDTVVDLSKSFNYSVFSKESILRVEHIEDIQKKPLSTWRHGLKSNAEDIENFVSKEYRYIYPDKDYKFPRRESVVTDWVKRGKMDKQTGWAILGYCKNFEL